MVSDEEQLRAYLMETFGGLQQDRSTASYALEFLRTERANLLTACEERMNHVQIIGELRTRLNAL